MAVERDDYVNFESVDPITPLPGLSNISCLVFGEGYWACPLSCPNILRREGIDHGDVLMDCEIISLDPDDYNHPTLSELGVSIIQPEQQRRFVPNPNS